MISAFSAAVFSTARGALSSEAKISSKKERVLAVDATAAAAALAALVVVVVVVTDAARSGSGATGGVAAAAAAAAAADGWGRAHLEYLSQSALLRVSLSTSPLSGFVSQGSASL